MKDVVAWELGKARRHEAHRSQGEQSLKKQEAAVDRSDTVRAQASPWFSRVKLMAPTERKVL